jgi:hypothetical protein
MKGKEGLHSGIYEYDFEIPGRTPMMNEYVRWHWTKQRQHTKDLAWMILKAVGIDNNREPIKKCLLFIERRARQNKIKAQTWDWDGLLGGMKGLIDAMTARHKSGVGLIEDDSIECIVSIPTIIPTFCEDGEHERTLVRIMKVD